MEKIRFTLAQVKTFPDGYSLNAPELVNNGFAANGDAR